MDMERMRVSLTKEQEKTLLLLSGVKWKKLRQTMKYHFKIGSYIPKAFNHLIALTSKQWHTIERRLTSVRKLNSDKLQLARKQVREEAYKNNKTEYMRNYMQRYRQRNGEKNGQGINQDSS